MDLFKQTTAENPSRRCTYRRRLHFIRFLLLSTIIQLIVTLILLHLYISQSMDPWPETLSSKKVLIYEPVKEVFHSKSVWVVTFTCVAGSLLSFNSLLSTFFNRGVSAFYLRRNLRPVESSGWVYESSPRPGISGDSHSSRHLQVEASARMGQHRHNKHSARQEQISMETFKRETTANVKPPLTPQISKDKLVLVDSNPIMNAAPLNLNFNNNSCHVLSRYSIERRSSQSNEPQYIPLKDLRNATEFTPPEKTPERYIEFNTQGLAIQ